MAISDYCKIIVHEVNSVKNALNGRKETPYKNKKKDPKMMEFLLDYLKKNLKNK